MTDLLGSQKKWIREALFDAISSQFQSPKSSLSAPNDNTFHVDNDKWNISHVDGNIPTSSSRTNETTTNDKKKLLRDSNPIVQVMACYNPSAAASSPSSECPTCPPHLIISDGETTIPLYLSKPVRSSMFLDSPSQSQEKKNTEKNISKMEKSARLQMYHATRPGTLIKISDWTVSTLVLSCGRHHRHSHNSGDLVLFVSGSVKKVGGEGMGIVGIASASLMDGNEKNNVKALLQTLPHNDILLRLNHSHNYYKRKTVVANADENRISWGLPDMNGMACASPVSTFFKAVESREVEELWKEIAVTVCSTRRASENINTAASSTAGETTNENGDGSDADSLSSLPLTPLDLLLTSTTNAPYMINLDEPKNSLTQQTSEKICSNERVAPFGKPFIRMDSESTHQVSNTTTRKSLLKYNNDATAHSASKDDNNVTYEGKNSVSRSSTEVDSESLASSDATVAKSFELVVPALSRSAASKKSEAKYAIMSSRKNPSSNKKQECDYQQSIPEQEIRSPCLLDSDNSSCSDTDEELPVLGINDMLISQDSISDTQKDEEEFHDESKEKNEECHKVNDDHVKQEINEIKNDKEGNDGHVTYTKPDQSSWNKDEALIFSLIDEIKQTALTNVHGAFKCEAQIKNQLRNPLIRDVALDHVALITGKVHNTLKNKSRCLSRICYRIKTCILEAKSKRKNENKTLKKQNELSTNEAFHFPRKSNVNIDSDGGVGKSNRNEDEDMKSWKCKYQKLADFCKIRGTLKSPFYDKHDFQSRYELQQFVTDQKKDYMKFQMGQPSQMVREKVDLLDKFDIDFSISFAREVSVRWKKGFESLKEHMKSHPEDLEHNEATIDVKQWVQEQRRAYGLMMDDKPNELSVEYAKALGDLGFDFKYRCHVSGANLAHNSSGDCVLNMINRINEGSEKMLHNRSLENQTCNDSKYCDDDADDECSLPFTQQPLEQSPLNTNLPILTEAKDTATNNSDALKPYVNTSDFESQELLLPTTTVSPTTQLKHSLHYEKHHRIADLDAVNIYQKDANTATTLEHCSQAFSSQKNEVKASCNAIGNISGLNVNLNLRALNSLISPLNMHNPNDKAKLGTFANHEQHRSNNGGKSSSIATKENSGEQQQQKGKFNEDKGHYNDNTVLTEQQLESNRHEKMIPTSSQIVEESVQNVNEKVHKVESKRALEAVGKMKNESIAIHTTNAEGTYSDSNDKPTNSTTVREKKITGSQEYCGGITTAAASIATSNHYQFTKPVSSIEREEEKSKLPEKRSRNEENYIGLYVGIQKQDQEICIHESPLLHVKGARKRNRIDPEEVYFPSTELPRQQGFQGSQRTFSFANRRQNYGYGHFRERQKNINRERNLIDDDKNVLCSNNTPQNNSALFHSSLRLPLDSKISCNDREQKNSDLQMTLRKQIKPYIYHTIWSSSMPKELEKIVFADEDRDNEEPRDDREPSQVPLGSKDSNQSNIETQEQKKYNSGLSKGTAPSDDEDENITLLSLRNNTRRKRHHYHSIWSFPSLT